MEQKPSVGRNVHYQKPSGETSVLRAAIITDTWVNPGEEAINVEVCVLDSSGLFFERVVPFSETPKPGHWNWPPRV